MQGDAAGASRRQNEGHLRDVDLHQISTVDRRQAENRDQPGGDLHEAHVCPKPGEQDEHQPPWGGFARARGVCIPVSTSELLRQYDDQKKDHDDAEFELEAGTDHPGTGDSSWNRDQGVSPYSAGDPMPLGEETQHPS